MSCARVRRRLKLSLSVRDVLAWPVSTGARVWGCPERVSRLRFPVLSVLAGGLSAIRHHQDQCHDGSLLFFSMGQAVVSRCLVWCCPLVTCACRVVTGRASGASSFFPTDYAYVGLLSRSLRLSFVSVPLGCPLRFYSRGWKPFADKLPVLLPLPRPDEASEGRQPSLLTAGHYISLRVLLWFRWRCWLPYFRKHSAFRPRRCSADLG